MLGFHGISVTPISALEEAGGAPPAIPDFGWFKARATAKVAGVLIAALVSHQAWVPQAPAVAADEPNFGWFKQRPEVKLQTVARTSVSRATFVAPPHVTAPVNFGWFTPQKPGKVQAANAAQQRPAWTPQQPSSLVATPSDLGWLGKQSPAKIQGPSISAPARAFIAPPEVTQPYSFGWFVQAKPVKVKGATPVLARLGRVPQVIAAADTAPNFGWYKQQQQGPVKAAAIAYRNSTSWTPQEPAAAGTAGYINVWMGAAWVLKPVKVWTGAAWVIKPVKFWSGASWIPA